MSSAIQFVRGSCPHDCPDTCATITEVQDGTAIRFYADPQHPFTQGWLCAKVRPYLERVYAEDRLLYPMRRVGPKGGDQWERITWQAALDEISSRWKVIIEQYGPAAILPYSYSGTLGVLQGTVTSERLWNRMGVSGLERSICGAAAETAVEMTLGARWGVDASDIIHSKLIVIWGSNPASTGPHFMPFLRQAQKQGAYVVVIDPRRSLTSKSADLHIQPRPSSDGALALGLMHVIFSEGLHDEAWLEAHSVGWRELRERVSEYPPERVAEITGVSAEVIIELARRYATTKPALLKSADGIQRHTNGGQTFRALCCLPAVVGQYGVLGGGLSYSTGGYGRFDGEAISHASECPPQPRIINMNRLGAALTGEVQDPPVMSLFVFGANPVASSPNSGKIVEGMLREDLFTVVHEQFMTDTARYADIVLPATTQLEQLDMHKAYGHRNLQINLPSIAPIGEAVSNWDLSRRLAGALGYDEPWLHQEAEEVLDEIIEATRKINPHYDGITLERLKAEAVIPFALTEQSRIPYANGSFPTPSGKVELYCEAAKAYGLDPLPHYVEPDELAQLRQRRKRGGDEEENAPSIILISSASHHFVSSSMGNQPSLRRKEGEPFVEINPDDAAARGIITGDRVIVENARGWCDLRAIVTDDVPPGVALAPKGQWAKLSPSGRNINWTTSDEIADLAGQSSFHSNVVAIRRA